MDPYRQFIQHIADNGGLLKSDPVIDGRWHNIPAEEGKAGNQSFGYIAFQNADGSIGGKIKNYHRHDESGASFIFHKDRGHQGFQDRSHQMAQRRIRQVRETEKAEARYARNAQIAKYVFDKQDPAPAEHPYLQRKQIQPHKAKINDAGQLVIPMINAAGEIQSLEFIGNNGFKKVMTGTKASGAFVPIGFNSDKRPEHILIAEGFATAASLYETTEIPAVHARGKGNLEQVAEIMQRRHPQAQIILAADNDQGKDRNVGLETAARIQERHPDLLIMRPGEAGDFNDLAVQENGRARIREQFGDPQAHQYLTESKAMQLLASGKYDALLNAARTDNIDLTPALAARMMEVPNAVFAREITKIALNDSSTAVREAAAEHLAKANEGAPGADFSDIGIADVQKIQADQTPHGQLAALQTDLDKSGIDLPDHIILAIYSWKKAIADRKDELSLTDDQVARLGTMLEARIIAHRDKKIAMPDELYQRRNRQKEITNER